MNYRRYGGSVPQSAPGNQAVSSKLIQAIKTRDAQHRKEKKLLHNAFVVAQESAIMMEEADEAEEVSCCRILFLSLSITLP